MVQHKFGYEVIGASVTSIEDGIVGSLFTCPEIGTADSITVALVATTSWTGKVKCAIYLHSTLGLVGQTDERTITLTSTATWFTFDFSGTKPDLTASTDYVLVAWAQAATGYCRMLYNAGSTNQGHIDGETYDGFPNPLVPTISYDDKYSIYCTYTVAGGGVTVKKGNSLVNTMTEMLNSKMLFSIAKLPRFTPRNVI